jgi:hypothetical protein
MDEHMSVADLAELIGKTVQLRKIGKNRWRGLCPIKTEATPSFDVWRGREGEGRYYCHGCKASGDSIDWCRLIGTDVAPVRADPERRRRRQQEQQRETVYQLVLDACPDMVPEALGFVESDALALLQLRLRCHLKGHLT